MKNFPLPDAHSSDTPTPEEASLVAFLKQHQSPAPPAAPDLEDLILQDIHKQQLNARKSKATVRWLALGVVVAASLTTWTMSQRQLQMAQNDKQLVQLQAFIEQSWDGVYTSDEEWVD